MICEWFIRWTDILGTNIRLCLLILNYNIMCQNNFWNCPNAVSKLKSYYGNYLLKCYLHEEALVHVYCTVWVEIFSENNVARQQLSKKKPVQNSFKFILHCMRCLYWGLLLSFRSVFFHSVTLPTAWQPIRDREQEQKVVSLI